MTDATATSPTSTTPLDAIVTRRYGTLFDRVGDDRVAMDLNAQRIIGTP